MERRVFPGVTHEVFGMDEVWRGAAETCAVTRLKPVLSAPIR